MVSESGLEKPNEIKESYLKLKRTRRAPLLKAPPPFDEYWYREWYDSYTGQRRIDLFLEDSAKPVLFMTRARFVACLNEQRILNESERIGYKDGNFRNVHPSNVVILTISSKKLKQHLVKTATCSNNRCNREFKIGPRKKYCSDKCSHENKLSKSGLYDSCHLCGTKYPEGLIRRKYCNNKCRRRQIYENLLNRKRLTVSGSESKTDSSDRSECKELSSHCEKCSVLA